MRKKSLVILVNLVILVKMVALCTFRLEPVVQAALANIKAFSYAT